MQSAGGHFDRLVRMVQETGERVVVSLEPGKDPVVLLPLSVYEQLTRQTLQVSVQTSEPELKSESTPNLFVRGFKPAPVNMDANHQIQGTPRSFIPIQTQEKNLDAVSQDVVDMWDGEEEGGEYDAERIFAQIDREKMNHTPSQAPDRLQASVSRVSEAFQGGWAVGSGGQRLPIRGQALQGEERFSLGAG